MSIRHKLGVDQLRMYITRYLDRPLIPVAAVLSAVVLGNLCIGLYSGFVALTTPYEITGAEGYVVTLIRNPGYLYHPLDSAPYLITNYPPVYLLTTYALHTGISVFTSIDVVYVGRFVSLVSTAGIAALIWLLGAEFVEDDVFATLGSLLFVVNPVMIVWGVTARVDALAAFFGLAAIYWFVTRTSTPQLAGTIVLCFLCLYTKQSAIAAPAALTVAFWIQDGRQRALVFVGTLGALGLGLLGVLTVLTDGSIFRQLVLYHLGTPTFVSKSLTATLMYVRTSALLILIPFFGILTRGRTVPVVLWIYAAIAFGVAALSVGKDGAGANYFVESTAIFALLTVVVLSGWLNENRPSLEAAARSRTEVTRAAFVLLVISAQFAVYPTIPHETHPRPGEAETADLLRTADGPVLSDTASVTLAAGKDTAYEPGVSSAAIHAGYWDGEPLLEAIQGGHYQYVVFTFNVTDRSQWSERSEFGTNRWTDEQLIAIRESYRLVERIGDYYVYRPVSE